MSAEPTPSARTRRILGIVHGFVHLELDESTLEIARGLIAAEGTSQDVSRSLNPSHKHKCSVRVYDDGSLSVYMELLQVGVLKRLVQVVFGRTLRMVKK